MPHSMVWLANEEIIGKVPCTCVDGRTTGMRYSAAGGSLGLIIHLLTHIEAKQHNPIDEKTLADLLAKIAQDIAPVYLHTDQHAIELIYARLGIEDETPLRQLTPTQQRSFIQFASQVDYQGCGHFKLMMQHPEEYGTTSSLVGKAVRTFLSLYFKGTDNVLFDVLKGEHHEETILIIDEQKNFNQINQTALYQEDTTEGNQFFCHRPLKRALLERFAAVIAEQALYTFSESELETLSNLLDQYAENTLGHLAGNLKISKINL